VPVYAVSGWPQDRLEPDSGFAAFFRKPIDLDALVATLQPLPRRPRRLRRWSLREQAILCAGARSR